MNASSVQRMVLADRTFQDGGLRVMHYTITRSAVHQHARQRLQACLRLRNFSPACTAGIFLHVLLAACARVCSLSAACRSLSRAPSRETIRRALLRWLPARDELLRRLNRALSVDVPRAWRRRPQQVAIDLTLIPYHGLPFTDVLEIYRARPRAAPVISTLMPPPTSIIGVSVTPWL